MGLAKPRLLISGLRNVAKAAVVADISECGMFAGAAALGGQGGRPPLQYYFQGGDTPPNAAASSNNYALYERSSMLGFASASQRIMHSTLRAR